MPIHNNIPPSWHNVIQTYLHTCIDISRRRYSSACNYKSDRYNPGTASLHALKKPGLLINLASLWSNID